VPDLLLGRQRRRSDVRFRTGKNTLAVVATETGLEELFGRMYPELKADDQANAYTILQGVNPSGEIEASGENEYELIDPEALAKDTKLPPIVRLVNLLLSDAAAAGASDVHIEPQEGHLLVRRRIDGLLEDVMRIQRDMQNAVISRLKIIAGMDIAERRKPQDGRSTLRLQDRRIDLRLSSLPTQFGEKIVVRLLDTERRQLDLANLMGTSDCLQKFRELLSRPQGMLLVAAPTGSGKTTTLYAALSWLRSSTKNIITVEDPIEYHIEGINQVQINPKAGMTFASGLRSILRQDPNVVLVGEIRDQETAAIAMEAAQTGHLLLSSLHTNDAVSAITRLLDLGIEPFLVASSLTAVVSQRLARKPCRSCVASQAPSADLIEKLGGPAKLPAEGAFVAGVGCDACAQLGYKGLTAIHELVVVTDEVRDLIARRAPDHEIRAEARSTGMRTLMEDGIDKAARGVTTLEEVARVVPPDEVHEGSHPPAAQTAAPPGGRDAGTSRQLAGRRVVVVEDSPTIATVVKYFLEIEGCEVFVAEDGRAGLEAVRQHRPHVVISDVNMPGMNGIEMVRELRARPDTSGTVILMLTSEDSVESEAQGLDVGADDYILKPVEPRRLAARVRALLGRSTARESVPR